MGLRFGIGVVIFVARFWLKLVIFRGLDLSFGEIGFVFGREEFRSFIVKGGGAFELFLIGVCRWS